MGILLSRSKLTTSRGSTECRSLPTLMACLCPFRWSNSKCPTRSNVMNSFRLINTAQLSKLRVFALAALLLVLGNQHLIAQVGGDNPTGVAGAFNGQVTTGCSYDAYTGNATRSVTDIAVAGAVGEYPLALMRTANSRRA